MTDRQPSFTTSLISGGIAGTSVDVALFPLDTIKTRMQSSQGFIKAGGFRGIYNGLAVAAAGSAPGAALFFSTYEAMKGELVERLGEERAPLAHMGAAATGETVACLVRVPTENVKQKVQAGLFPTARAAGSSILAAQGPMGFYTGYGTTVAREIPFAFIQFPIYEAMKKRWAAQRAEPLLPVQGALCGSISGAFAAAVTTPLDVIKTRLMLGDDGAGGKYNGLVDTGKRILNEEGAAKLFSGIQPRVMWIGIGGFVFFGAYESCKDYLMTREEQ